VSFLNYTGLLFLLTIPVIVLLYLLKLKRRPVVVSSLILWQKSIQDLIANQPFQKLKANIFLLLQILIAVMLALAIARPILESQPLKRRTIVMVIDRSASMKTREADGKTRLDNAKRIALESIANLKRNDIAMVIAFDDSATVLQGFTNDKKLLKERIQRLEATDSISNIQETFSIMSSLFKNNEDIEVILLSDGNIFEAKGFTAPLPDIKYVKIGKSDNNTGFTQFSIRPNFESPFDFEIFANVQNFSTRNVTTAVELFVDEIAVDIKGLELKAGASSPVIFPVTSSEQKKVRLTLDVDDALMEDNEVFGVIPGFKKIELLLITTGNYFFEQALGANPFYTLHIQKPSDTISFEQYDVAVFDGYSPQAQPPLNSIFFNALPPGGAVVFTQEKENPIIVDTDRQHPVMRYTRVENALISKGMKMTVSGAVSVLAETDDSPIIVLAESGEVTSLVAGFDIYDSDFPLKPSFPIFLNNAIQFLSGRYGGAVEHTLSTRDGITLKIEDGAERFVLVTPDDKQHDLHYTGEQMVKFTSTKATGFYELIRDGETAGVYGVNLVSARESDIKPRDIFEVGKREIVGTPTIKQANVEIWRYFIWAALLVLIVEWLLYWRRMTL